MNESRPSLKKQPTKLQTTSLPSSKNLSMNELSAELKKTNLTTNDLSAELKKIN
jgi:hypothetical protein